MNVNINFRSKEWFLKIDQKRASRLSKYSRQSSSSSPHKQSKYFSSDEQDFSRKDSSPVYHDVNMKKSNTSLSSFDMSEEQLSFPPPPSTIKDLLKADRMSIYSKADEQSEKIVDEKINMNNTSTKSDDNRVKVSNLSTSFDNDNDDDVIQSEPKESIRKSNVFTSSSHSMVDPGCGGHIISKIPALRCLRPHKQHQTQKFPKTSSKRPAAPHLR